MSLKRSLHTTSCAHQGCAEKGPERVATVCSACNTSNRLGLRSFGGAAYHAIAEKGEIAVFTKPLPPSRSVAGTAAPGGARGFTLIEVIIVVAIVAILAAIAIPNYADYVRRGKIIEATSGLSDMRARLEQWYLDKRTYANGCTTYKATVQATIHTFTLDCTAEGANNYKVTVTGNAPDGMGAFVYWIDEQNRHGTDSTAWGDPPTNLCWLTRKGATCS
jgi:type IV pilus assembly protein PilE